MKMKFEQNRKSGKNIGEMEIVDGNMRINEIPIRQAKNIMPNGKKIIEKG